LERKKRRPDLRKHKRHFHRQGAKPPRTATARKFRVKIKIIFKGPNDTDLLAFFFLFKDRVENSWAFVFLAAWRLGGKSGFCRGFLRCRGSHDAIGWRTSIRTNGRLKVAVSAGQGKDPQTGQNDDENELFHDFPLGITSSYEKSISHAIKSALIRGFYEKPWDPKGFIR
jgi:hypothetical protein